MKPVVDRLEEQYAGRLKIIRVDIQSTAGETIAQEYGLFMTPSFLFFDAQGHEAFRTVGSLDVNQIRILLADPQ
jgi:thioredoxin-like negative regulator of GroEL